MPRRRNERIQLPLNERIKDGRIFEISKRSNTGVIYLRCRTRFCVGTAKKLPNGDIVSLQEHSAICFADRNAQLKADFLQALKAALRRNFWKLKELYETVAAMYPREIKIALPYNSILSSLKRWRRRCYPPCPASLELMADQLSQPENQQLLEYEVGRLAPRTIRDTEGNVHLLMYDPHYVRDQFANVSRLFIDGTFQTTPQIRGVHQLVSVLGVKYDHAFPFAHILMSKRTQCSYTAVFNEITAHLINSDSVTVVMTDYEHALRNACRAVFPNAIIAGCSVHYDRAVMKKIKSLRLTRLIRDNEEAKLFLKKIMALAYLPATMIEAEYANLKSALSAPLKRAFGNFLNYYNRQWLRTVKPAGFSVYRLSRRTNNVIESYNSVLADKLGQHPSVWTFLGKLIKLTSYARDDLESLRLHKRIKRHPRYATIFKQRQLIDAWRKLNERRITPAEFMDQAAALKGHVSQALMRFPAEAVDNEAALEEGPNEIPLANDPDYDGNIFMEDLEVAPPAQNDESDVDDANSSFATDISSPLAESGPEVEDENHEDRLLSDDGPHEEVRGNERLASKSRKRNLRKKRRLRNKRQDGAVQARPYGHKRRANKNKNVQAPKCVVCLENTVTHVFVPCGHNCVCLRSAEVLDENEVKRCPKCRANFTQFIAVYTEPVGD